VAHVRGTEARILTASSRSARHPTAAATGAQPVAIGVAAASAGLYAALHSLLASDEAQALARRVCGPVADRWYRLAYNALAVGLLVAQERLLARLPSRTVYTLPPPWRSVARLAQLGAFVGLAACLRLTDAATFLGLRQAGLLPSHRRPLVESGPYGRVRHPTYWCMLGILWCKSPMTSVGLSASLVFTLYLGVGSFFEERRLIREFGPAYLEYRRRVPRLLPVRPPGLQAGEVTSRAALGPRRASRTEVHP
jgi:protein-S-isoprenylcysteine O-methyltransferase Ste14